MELITRILFGKKKVRQTKAEPIETEQLRPIETERIRFNLYNNDYFNNTSIIETDCYYVIIKKILDLIQYGSFTFNMGYIEYENEKIFISYSYSCKEKNNILRIFDKQKEPQEPRSLIIQYDLQYTAEKLFSIAIDERLEKENIIRKEKLNAKRKEAEQSILKHL